MEEHRKFMASRQKSIEFEEHPDIEEDLKHTMQTFIDVNVPKMIELVLEVKAGDEVSAATVLSSDQNISSLQHFSNMGLHAYVPSLPYSTALLAYDFLKHIVATHKSTAGNTCGSLMGEVERENIVNLLAVIVNLKAQNRLASHVFIQRVVQMEVLPLEILWFLHTRSIMRFITYLYHSVDRMEVMNKLTDGFLQMMDPLTDECQQKVVTELLSALLLEQLSHVMPDVLPNHECITICSDLLNTLVYKTSSALLDTSGQAQYVPSGIHFILLKQCSLNPKSLQQFLLNSFHSLVTHQPDVSAEEAMKLQEQWTHNKLPKCVAVYLENLLKAMGPHISIQAIRYSVVEGNINWELMLKAVPIFMACDMQSTYNLKGLVNDLLHQAFSDRDRRWLATVFLLAREACSHSQTFQSYSDWFSSTFGSKAAKILPSATNQQAFEFLLSFLTDAVPHERALYLRVHINKVPQTPANCCKCLSDFVQLTKTRLRDHHQSLHGGLFGFDNTVEEDLTYALELFEQANGQVSGALQQAILFNPQKYEEEFLPTLLRPRILPWPLDVKGRFVEKLHQMGKIASSVYSKYKVNCEQVASGKVVDFGKKLEAKKRNIFSPDAWKKALSLLTKAVRDDFQEAAAGEEDAKALLQHFEDTKTHVCTMLKDIYRKGLEADLKDFRVTTTHKTVVANFLEAFIQCFHEPEVLEGSVDWPFKWLSIIHPFPVLGQLLNDNVKDLCMENNNLPDHQIRAAAVLALTVHSKGCTPLMDSVSLAEILSKEMPLSNCQEMIHYFRFATFYMEYADLQVSSFTDNDLARRNLLALVPTMLLVKYNYVWSKLESTMDREVLAILNRSWNPYLVQNCWHLLLAKGEMQFDEWIELEFQSQDVLDDVQWLCYGSLWLYKYRSESSLDVANKLLDKAIYYACKVKDGQLFSHRLLSALSEDRTEIQGSPWLLLAWENLNHTYSNEDIFRVVQRMPAGLLFPRQEEAIGSDIQTSVAAVAEFITNHLRDGLTEKGFLPYYFVRYVLHGLLQNFLGQASEALSHLLDTCPSFRASVLAHGSLVQPILKKRFSSVCGQTQDSSAICIQQIISIVLPHTDENPPIKICIEEMLGLLPKCRDWEIALVMWFAGNCSLSSEGMSVYRNYSTKCNDMLQWLPPGVQNWFFLFNIVELGNLLVEGKIQVEFDDDDFKINVVEEISRECVFNVVITQLVTHPKILEMLHKAFQHMDQEALGSLSEINRALTAITMVLLLVSIPPRDLEQLLVNDTMAVYFCQTLLACHAKWRTVAADIPFWSRLKDLHQLKTNKSQFNLMDVDFVTKICACVKFRSTNVAEYHNIHNVPSVI